jgi:hypothetical protein
MLGSLVGALGLAAVGAERKLTVSLSPAIMFIGVPVALSMGSILGAFDTLATLYALPAQQLFVYLVAFGGVFAVFFLASALVDSVEADHSNGEVVPSTEDEARWLKNTQTAVRQMWTLLVLASVVLAIALTLRLTGTVTIGLSTTVVYSIALSAGIASIAATIRGQLRTVHGPGDLRSVTRTEAITVIAVVALYFAFLILVVP